MGDIAEMILDGALCQTCGECIQEGDAPGYPRYCSSQCWEAGYLQDDFIARYLKGKGRVSCPQCGKRVKATGLKDHQRDKHGTKS